MSLTDGIRNYGSVAVVGLAKNVGKTETLNYLIRETYHSEIPLGITSIGIDGEAIDQVSMTKKPEITVYEGMMFATSEPHYRSRRLEAEVMEIGSRNTSLGRVVTGKALSNGKILLSGPSETSGVKKLIDSMHKLGAHTVFIDGALSRLSPASPAVTEGMILSTGAAVSPDIITIVKKTLFVCRLIEIPKADNETVKALLPIENGIRFISVNNVVSDPGLKSALDLEKLKEVFGEDCKAVYISGMVGDKLLLFLSNLARKRPLTLFVRDFTRLFVEPATLAAFTRCGGDIKVLRKTSLIGVTINPWSPNGYSVNGSKLRSELQNKLEVPVVNVRCR